MLQNRRRRRPAADLLLRAPRILLQFTEKGQPGGDIDALIPQQGLLPDPPRRF